MKKLVDFFSNIGEGAWAINAEQKIVFWNQQATDILGYTEEDVIGNPCQQVLACSANPSRTTNENFCPVQNAVHRGKPVEPFDITFLHKDGSRILLNVSTLVIPIQTDHHSTLTTVHLCRKINYPIIDTGFWRVKLLGSMQVYTPDGNLLQHANWTRSRVRGLFAYFSLKHDQFIHRDQLIDIFWPDLNYSAGLKNLNTNIYHLRQCLQANFKDDQGANILIFAAQQYQFAANQNIWVDALEFEQKITTARKQTSSEISRELIQDALELYKDRFLKDIIYDNRWAETEQQRLQLLYLEGLAQLGEMYLDIGRLDQAGACYHRLFYLDPCNEKNLINLVKLCKLQGDYAEAYYLYQVHTRALKELLGTHPFAKDFRSFYEQLE